MSADIVNLYDGASSTHVADRSERVRVMLFTSSVAAGGMEEHVRLLAKHLSRAEFRVYGVVPADRTIAPFSRGLADVCDDFAEITPDRRFGVFKQLKETFRLYHALKDWKIDVVHLHSGGFTGLLGAFVACKMSGVKKIFITEHLAPYEGGLPFWPRLVKNTMARLSTAIVCVSNKNYETRKKHLYTPASTQIVDNGVDLSRFTPVPAETLSALRAEYDIPADALIVGSVVRLSPEKGLDDLINAMPKVKAASPNAYLLLVGDGPLREELTLQAEKVGCLSYTRFAGFHDNPLPFMGLIDAFVLPVPVGSMSIALLEAMAMRRAVVITFGGEGEAVVDGESGLCPPPRNPEALAAAISTILTDPEKRAAFGEAARRRIEENFSAERVAKMLGELYRK